MKAEPKKSSFAKSKITRAVQAQAVVPEENNASNSEKVQYKESVGLDPLICNTCSQRVSASVRIVEPEGFARASCSEMACAKASS